MLGSSYILLICVAGATEPPGDGSALSRAAHEISAPKDKPPKKKAGPRYTISKETTYVTGPLDKEGYIDYAAALKERLRQGVTPANNANVLLWEAMGPRPEGASMPAEFFEWMGVKRPPEKGEYFVDVGAFMNGHIKDLSPERRNEIFNELDMVTSWPWTAKEYPHFAGWLKANENSLVLALQASRKPKYYSPLLPSSTERGLGWLYVVQFPGAHKSREVAQAFAARAMLHAGEKRPSDAWQDLVACHRLGRVVAQGGTLLEGLIGVAIHNIASNATLVFLDQARLDGKQIRECLSELQRLPAMPQMAEKMDLAERITMLDTAMWIERYGLLHLHKLGRTLKFFGFFEPWVPEAAEPILAYFYLRTIDWDPFLKNCNAWFDHLARAMRIEDRARREENLSKIAAELRQQVNRWPWEALHKALENAKTPGEALGKVGGDIFICRMAPAFRKMQDASDRVEQQERNLHIAFALAAYQREQGRYPMRIDELEPQYLPKVPRDLFTGKAIVYRATAKGYLLYSLGANGRDDDGHGYDDGGDDLVVRMPAPAPRKDS